eukprot:6027096-Amphidinium_carterae.1
MWHHLVAGKAQICHYITTCGGDEALANLINPFSDHEDYRECNATKHYHSQSSWICLKDLDIGCNYSQDRAPSGKPSANSGNHGQLGSHLSLNQNGAHTYGANANGDKTWHADLIKDAEQQMLQLLDDDRTKRRHTSQTNTSMYNTMSMRELCASHPNAR